MTSEYLIGLKLGHPRPPTVESGEQSTGRSISPTWFWLFCGDFLGLTIFCSVTTGSPQKGPSARPLSKSLLYAKMLILFQKKPISLFRKCEPFLETVNVHTPYDSPSSFIPLEGSPRHVLLIKKFFPVILITACYRTLSSLVISANFHHYFRTLRYISSDVRRASRVFLLLIARTFTQLAPLVSKTIRPACLTG
jgi:hypothetical protein